MQNVAGGLSHHQPIKQGLSTEQLVTFGHWLSTWCTLRGGVCIWICRWKFCLHLKRVQLRRIFLYSRHIRLYLLSHAHFWVIPTNLYLRNNAVARYLISLESMSQCRIYPSNFHFTLTLTLPTRSLMPTECSIEPRFHPAGVENIRLSFWLFCSSHCFVCSPLAGDGTQSNLWVMLTGMLAKENVCARKLSIVCSHQAHSLQQTLNQTCYIVEEGATSGCWSKPGS